MRRSKSPTRSTMAAKDICAEYAHSVGFVKRHYDFGSAVCDIAYGLCLSEKQILDDVDTEIVVLPAVMGQNLPCMTYWHFKGF